MIKQHKLLLLFFVIIAISLSMVILVVNQEKQASPGTTLKVNAQESVPKAKVKIIDGLSANSPFILIADKMGFFEKAGLDVNVSYTALGKLAMDALNSGSVDYAGVVEMNVAHTLFSHDDISILCEYSEPKTGIKVLGRGDKGIHSAKDLRGKKIGVFFGVNIHVFIIKVLEEAGIALKDVELVNLKPADAAAAFVSGSIDAVVTWEPLISLIREKLGDKITIITEDSQRYWPYKLILVTKRSYLEKKPEQAKKVLKAILMAEEYFNENPNEVYSLLSEHLKIDKNKIARMCDEISYEVKLSPRLIEMISYETKWLPHYLPMFFQGKRPVSENYFELISDSLKGIKPETYHVENNVND